MTVRGEASWGVAFAWPGCEGTAPLFLVGLPGRADALLAADWEAAGWSSAGYLVVQLPDGGGWAICRRETPDRIEGKLVLRNSIGR